MMIDFKSSQKQSLDIHPDKTYILTNQGSNKRREVEVDQIRVEILPMEGKVRYLGQMISFADQGTVEIQHRVRCVITDQ